MSRKPPTDARNKPSILIVDDEFVIRNAFQIYFETVGWNVALARDGEEAIVRFRERPSLLDVVLLDLSMPGLHGIEVLRRLKELDHSVEVVIATGCGNMTLAIEALRHGAFDFVTKPIVDLDHDLLRVAQAALARRSLGLGRSAPAAAAYSPTAGPQPSGVECGVGDPSSALQLEALERLAQALLHGASPRETLGSVARFAEKHLGVVASYYFEPGDQAGFGILEQWGPWAGALSPQGDPASLGALRLSLARPRTWQPVRNETASSAGLCDLEGLYLSAGAIEGDSDPGIPRVEPEGLSFLMLRKAPVAPPLTSPLALLSVVAQLALDRAAARQAAS